MLLAYNEIYPGTRWDEDPKCPEELGVDGGGEFQSDFYAAVSSRGTKVVPGLPHRSETNAYIERDNEELQRGVATLLDASGFPYRFWSYAARFFQYVRTRKRGPNGAPSPFAQLRGFEDPQEVVPFGCLVWYHHDEHLKYGARGREGAVIGYADHQAYLVLDVRSYVESGGHQVSIYATRDVRLDRTRMPMREHAIDQTAEAREFERSFRPPRKAATYRAAGGQTRCTTCGKIVTDQPVTCKACLTGKKHPRGMPGPACALSRCKGHAEELAEEEDEAAGVDPGQASSSSHAVPNAAAGSDEQLRHIQRVQEAYNKPVQGEEAVRRMILGDDYVPDAPEFRAVREAQDALPAGQDYVPAPVDPGPPLLLAGRTTKASSSKNLLSKDPLFSSPPTFRSAKARVSRPPRAQPDPILDAMEEMRLEIDRKNKETEDEASAIAQALGFVFRVIDEFSWEAKTSPAIEKAVQEEFQGLLDMGAISLGDVREWSAVIQADPKAKHARMRFVLGQKNAELDESQRRIKARMVVGGHDVRDAHGQRCVDVLHHIVPVGMTSIRLCHAHAAA